MGTITHDLWFPGRHRGWQKCACSARWDQGNVTHLVFSLPGFVAPAAAERSSSFGCSLHTHEGNLGICCVDPWSLLHKVASTEKIPCHLETGRALSEVCLACPYLQKISKHTKPITVIMNYVMYSSPRMAVESTSIKLHLNKGYNFMVFKFCYKTQLQ